MLGGGGVLLLAVYLFITSMVRCDQMFHWTFFKKKRVWSWLNRKSLAIKTKYFLAKVRLSLFSKNKDCFCPIGLHHPIDGVTNPMYKLLRFIQLTFFCKEKKVLAFNRDTCCHLVMFTADPLPVRKYFAKLTA